MNVHVCTHKQTYTTMYICILPGFDCSRYIHHNIKNSTVSMIIKVMIMMRRMHHHGQQQQQPVNSNIFNQQNVHIIDVYMYMHSSLLESSVLLD